ncbi:hypothetical protein [Geobacillus thermodenitrificans]|jgi:hypothetical protein|uniref:Uncharacterized protein n=1 Tax=Geobacillus thermodenitrificans (strain NG80-2) TaxID=420246 RepID=A4IT40_GEOTN|nr:hypothetical protein [Geobacillus thermodenitrificans]ABO68494.1 hypothetical protein GTNG_3149 [Geobacillus thermodenitrificans NG80-2]
MNGKPVDNQNHHHICHSIEFRKHGVPLFFCKLSLFSMDKEALPYEPRWMTESIERSSSIGFHKESQLPRAEGRTYPSLESYDFFLAGAWSFLETMHPECLLFVILYDAIKIGRRNLKVKDVFVDLPTLTTEYLILGKLTLDDAYNLFNYASNLENRKYLP